MQYLLANSGDPTRIETLLYAHEYHSRTINIDGITNLLILYAVPAIIAIVFVSLVLVRFRQQTVYHWSAILIFVSPFLMWASLMFADSSAKAFNNAYEIAFLGALVGIVLGINRQLMSSWLNGVTTAWVLTVAALGVWLFVPESPPPQAFFR